MRTATHIQTVAAYGRLLEYSSNKRYGLLDNSFINNDIDRLALEFNEIIKTKSGLDITVLEDDELILKYEDIVDEQLTKFTYEKIIVKDESDIGKLLSGTYNISGDFLKNKRIGISKFVKDFIKLSSISNPSLLSYCKTPHIAYATNWGESEPQQIFLNSFVLHKGKGKILLLQVRKVNSEEQNKWNIDWQIDFAGLFSKEENLIYLDVPLKLFIKVLNDYCIDFEVNNIKKRFIYSLTIPKTYSLDDVTLQVQGKKLPPSNSQGLNINFKGKNQPIYSCMQIKITLLGLYISSAYVLQSQLFLTDSLSGKI